MPQCCNPGCDNPVDHEGDECRPCFDLDADELTVAESYEHEGTWSWMCPHGDRVDACWECGQGW